MSNLNNVTNLNDLLIFLSFVAFVLSPCFIALRSRNGREEAKLAPRAVRNRAPRPARGARRKLIVDSLDPLAARESFAARESLAFRDPRASRSAPREAARREKVCDAAQRHARPRSPYMSMPSAAQGRRRGDPSVFIPPIPQIPALGYTLAPVPALVYGVTNAAPEDLVCLLVLPGARAQQQRPYGTY